ncbi:hypothetical protein SAMN05519104_3981 [Rhizobiales bacterium GAS188]|nr:hypothetical protein SAMN05519104_3981 [Rhizobiales bacterium GAS188]
MTENIGVHTDRSSNEVRRIRSAYAERERTHKSNEGNPGRQRLLRERNDTLELEPGILLPPVVHQLGRLTDRTCPLLASMPILRSHYIGLLRPSRGSGDRTAEPQPLRL